MPKVYVARLSALRGCHIKGPGHSTNLEPANLAAAQLSPELNPIVEIAVLDILQIMLHIPSSGLISSSRTHHTSLASP